MVWAVPELVLLYSMVEAAPKVKLSAPMNWIAAKDEPAVTTLAEVKPGDFWVLKVPIIVTLAPLLRVTKLLDKLPVAIVEPEATVKEVCTTGVPENVVVVPLPSTKSLPKVFVVPVEIVA